ncbi:MAG: hypothetical protein K2L76_02620 [Muribaculaceae bacterium]|nr:hypothetical protein [Muribaculaceae bacterium]
MSIRHFLQHRLPPARKFPPGRPVVYHEQIFTGTFALNDAHACGACRNNTVCNNENLIIVAGDTTVHAVDLEEYLDQFRGTAAEFHGARCDFLLYDDCLSGPPGKIAFCDLTCSDSSYIGPNNGKYPQGKRIHAFNQMRTSMTALIQSEVMLGLAILSRSRRQLIFAWRDPGRPHADNAERNMMLFSTTPATDEPILQSLQSSAGYGFEFVQIKYDRPYLW